MIEPRLIAGELFIASRTGKRETLQTPAEAIDAARAEIAEHEAGLRKLAESADILTVELEHAAYFGEPTGELRRGLIQINGQAEQVQSAIDGQRNQIEAINAAVNQHQATRLAREHAGHIAALVAPFDKILMECRP